MKPTIKTSLILNFIFCFIGFIVGLRTEKQAPKTIQTEINTKTQEQASTNTDSNRQQADDKHEVFLETQYSPRGTIKKTIEIRSDYTSTIKKDTSTIHTVQTNITQTENKKEIIDPLKNWLLIGLIPTSNYKDYSNYTIQLSYRVIGPLYASFQTNLVFNRPMVGIGFQF